MENQEAWRQQSANIEYKKRLMSKLPLHELGKFDDSVNQQESLEEILEFNM